jgi:chemotaxis methyl-accepting protein methylase
MLNDSVVVPRGRASRFRHIIFDPAVARSPVIDFAARNPAADPLRPWLSIERPAAIPLREDEAQFVRHLFVEAGIDGNAYRSETIRRRLPACLRALRVRSVAEARQTIERDRTKAQRALDALVIGVTSFFRDTAVFDYLASAVFPQLPRPPKPRRIWSAGCSDGDELYSIAILLAEHGLLDEGATLLGSDCRGQAIGNARVGRYAAAQLRDVPDAWRDRYFHPAGAGAWQVIEPLRDAVQWRTADITSVREPGGWDLILCRNMAMYLRPEVAGRLWQEFEHALRPGGFLVLGKAERPIGTQRLTAVGPCVYRRHKGLGARST